MRGFRKLLIIGVLAAAHFALQALLLFANASVKMAVFESPARDAVLESMNRRADILLNVFGFPMFQLANFVPSHGIPYLDWLWFGGAVPRRGGTGFRGDRLRGGDAS